MLTGESLIGIFASMTALVGAIFTGMVALRHAKRDVATADVMELRAYREAWVWATRTIYRLLALLGPTDVDEPKGIREKLQEHQDHIDNPNPVIAKKEG